MIPEIPWPGGKRVIHVKQLQSGSPTASTDCGLASLEMGLQVASGDELRIPRDLWNDWTAILRSEMTHFGFWPATSLPNHEQAMKALGMTWSFLTLGLFKATAWDETVRHAEAIDLLREGHALTVGIDYGALNRLMPRLSGSKTFMGGHFIHMHGAVREGGEWWTRLGDPLHDGRQSYPRGWQTVRVRRYLRAAETFGGAGAGKAKVLAIRPAKERT